MDSRHITNISILALKITLFGIFLFLIYHFVLKTIDTQLVLYELKRSDFLFIFTAFIFMMLRFLFLGFKFRIASLFLNINLPTKDFLIYEFKLLFMEFLVPVPNAEDLFRVLFLKIKNISFSKCLNTVLAMRVTGMFTLGILLITFYAGSMIIEYNRNYIFLLIGILLILLFTHRLWIKLMTVYLSKPAWLNKLLKSMLLDKLSYNGYLSLIVISFLHYLASATVIYFLLRSFGEELSITVLLSIIPIMSLSFLVPLSVQGLGLPEAVLLFVLLRLNVPGEIASSVSLTHLMMYISVILSGGILFFLDKTYSLDFIKEQITALKRSKGRYLN